MSTEPGVREGEEAAAVATESANAWALGLFVARAAGHVLAGHHLAENPTDTELAAAEADLAVVQRGLAAMRRAKEG